MESMEATTSILLPDDILEEILVRIPVKYLLRWKCVCKHWYALIQDYDFVKKHYHFQYAQHYLADHGTVPLFLNDRSRSDENPNQLTRFYVMSKHGDGQDDVVLNVTNDFVRDCPPDFFTNDSKRRSLSLMGIVNGVICLEWGCFGGITSALWNPATREFKEVPRWPVMSEDFGGFILGLGFDIQSKDFKILIQKRVCNDSGVQYREVYEYHLYSLKANSWKTLKENPSYYLVCSTTDGYLNNGLYYWVGVDQSNVFPSESKATDKRDVILSFNFSTELFKESELPEWSLPFELAIGKYKETLALFVEKSDSNLELWAASRFREDDYGVPLSWQLVVKVSLSLNISYISLRIRRIRECGDVLLLIQRGDSSMEDRDYGLYDPATHAFKNLGFSFYSNFSYVESLFSLYPRRVNQIVSEFGHASYIYT